MKIRLAANAAGLVMLVSMLALSACQRRAEASKPASPQSPATIAPATSATKAEPVPDGFVRVTNKLCPILTDHAIRKGMVLSELSAEYRGQTIGFCCEDCVDAWRAMNDDEREAALKEAARLADEKPR